MLFADLEEACGVEPGRICRFVFDQTDSDALAVLADVVLARALRILMILVVAYLINRLLRGTIAAFGERLVDQHSRHMRQTPRSSARQKTLVAILGSAASIIIWTIVGLLVLGEFDISIAPLLAGAGVVGVALGFGAQSIVADFLSGFFMLAEDQFGVGDVIDVGEVSGTVEDVSLRTTTLRDVQGNVWHVPNSEIRRVANMSQLWSRAVLDIEVAYDTDIRRAEGVIQRVADDLWNDESFKLGDIVDPPEVWGVERLGADGVSIRLVVKTDPADQFMVARELRLRIKEAFDEAQIEIPFPQRTIWIRQDNPIPRDERTPVPTAKIRLPKADDTSQLPLRTDKG